MVCWDTSSLLLLVIVVVVYSVIVSVENEATRTEKVRVDCVDSSYSLSIVYSTVGRMTERSLSKLGGSHGEISPAVKTLRNLGFLRFSPFLPTSLWHQPQRTKEVGYCTVRHCCSR